MSVPNHHIDCDDEPCFECFVEEVGRAAAEEIRENEGGRWPLCRSHEREAVAAQKEDWG